MAGPCELDSTDDVADDGCDAANRDGPSVLDELDEWSESWSTAGRSVAFESEVGRAAIGLGGWSEPAVDWGRDPDGCDVSDDRAS